MNMSVASSLNMTVTAEGVENKEQFEYLKKIGCDYAQGYYISSPLTLKEAINFSTYHVGTG